MWDNGKNLDIRAIAIDAATGEVLGDGAGGDEISHRVESGAHGAIVPENKKKKNNEDFGVETLKLKTLLDGSDYKDYGSSEGRLPQDGRRRLPARDQGRQPDGIKNGVGGGRGATN